MSKNKSHVTSVRLSSAMIAALDQEIARSARGNFGSRPSRMTMMRELLGEGLRARAEARKRGAS